jgi:cytochrome c
MRKFFVVTLVLVVGFFLAGYAFADDKADCVSLSEAAAKMMKEDLAGALCEINKKDGKFVKGKIFVFAWRGGVLVAHPFRTYAIGSDLINHKDKEGKEFVKEYLKVVKEKGSGWVSYKWPKPGEKELSDKVTYVLKVDENFYVTAGYFK